MLVYRIVHKKYADSLFAGGMAGRWNREGKKVLYTAENVSLAYLETMHYRKGLGYNRDFRLMIIEVAQSAFFQEVDLTVLPKNWREFRNYEVCQRVGDAWFDNADHLCLRVPSAVVVQNYNVVINTLHKDYTSVKLIDVLNFEPDDRLEEIIKAYKN